jgi:hypothetical protein
MAKRGPSLRRRQEMAEEGTLQVETHSGEWVGADEAYTCPDACGSVFESEEAFQAFCPVDCGAKDAELRARARAAEAEEVWSVFCLYREDGRPLKVTRSLGAVESLWWWRNVSRVVVLHLSTQEAAEAAVGRLVAHLKPVYDLDPGALDEPRPLRARIPEPISGANNIPLTIRVSDELESRIMAQAEAEGLTRSEWLRRLAELHT